MDIKTKDLIIKTFRIVGIDLTRISFSKVKPFANYEPWKLDTEFLTLYRSLRGFTLVDIYRCYELWTLINEVKQLDGDIIEVGVWRGGTGTLIAKKASLLGLKSTVYLCDTFSGVVKAGDKDTDYTGGEHSDTSSDLVKKLLEKNGIKNTEVVTGIFPDDNRELFKNKKFRFCHIDVDVYQSAKDVFNYVFPGMPVGAMVVFDDYGFKACYGVTKFVDENRGLADRIVIHNLNGHAIIVKRS